MILFLPEGVTGFADAPAIRAHAGDARAAPAAATAGEQPRSARTRSAAPLLVCADVRKAFRGVQALRGVSLEVREGEILGLVGPNGSGKSTLINVVSGHYRADGGRIVVDGVDLAGRPAHEIARLGVSRTYQIPRPFAHLTVRDNVALAGMFGRRGREPARGRARGGDAGSSSRASPTARTRCRPR